jgi:spermidine synthase
MANLNQTRDQKLPSSFLILGCVALIFLATGACGLVYQVAWQRYLLNLFGATIYSVSTVLAAFMGGLALGSFVFGRLAERIRNPLRLYALLEAGVGVAALLVPLLLKGLDPLFVQIYRHWGSNFFAYSLLRFAFVFCILLLPTTMMGGTLPLLSKFVSPAGRRPGARVGALYALNTLGAVAGTVACGFYLLRWWGIASTVRFAAVLNLLAGAVAIALSTVANQLPDDSRRASAPIDTEPDWMADTRMAAAIRKFHPLVLLAYFLSGFAALGLEVVWSRGLVFTFDLLKNTTYSFTAMLAVYLAGIAVGSAIAAPFVERDRSPWRSFAILEILIGLVSTVSFFVIYYVCYTLGGNWSDLVDAQTGALHWGRTLALVFTRSGAVVFLPTLLMGFAFPYAVRCVVLSSGRKHVGREVGHLYALNTVGAIIGSFLTGFFLLPAIGIAGTIWLLGALQAVMGGALIWFAPDSLRSRRWLWGAVAAAALLITFARLPRPAIFQPLEQLERLVFYKEGPLATVAVTENSLRYRTIFVDNVGVAGTEPILLTDQKSLAHIPMLFLEDPKRALTVGFGSGGASYSYTLHPQLAAIDCVEITDTVIEAAPTLTDSNHDVIMHADEYRRRTGTMPQGVPLWDDGGRSGWYKSDPRYRIVLDDVRSYLHFTDTRYDVIATDCTDLRYKSNANLYDREYFTLARQRITDNGMVVVWMPLAGLSDEAFRVALRTFYRVFPNMEIFYMNNEPTHYILLIGTKQPLKVDLARMRERLTNPKVNADLAELQLNSAEKLLSCFVCGRDALKQYLAGDTLNTEDFPYLEFESPRFGYGDAPLLMNLESLFRLREHPARLLTQRDAADTATLRKLNRYYEAVPDIIEGHHHYRRLEILDAARCWQRALEKNPEDASVKNLLMFQELRRKAAGQPDNLWARLTLGEVLLLQNRPAEAATHFIDVVARAKERPNLPKAADFYKAACLHLADIYERRGKKHEAQEYRDYARAGLPTATSEAGQ